MKLLFLLCSMLSFQCFAQAWENIETPVTSNLILFDINFPGDQSDIGYTGGSSTTFNGQGTLLKTIDGGDSWEILWSSTDPGTGITAMYFFSPTVGLVGTMDGTLKMTADGGDSWTDMDIASGIDQGEIRDIDFIDEMNGALVTSWEGIYFTSDGGDTWNQATTNYLGAQSLAYSDENNVFACGGNRRIYRSQDGGANWSQTFQGPNAAML